MPDVPTFKTCPLRTVNPRFALINPAAVIACKALIPDEIFRPFLLHYYNIHYTRKGEHYKNACSREFNIKLKKFYKFNPLFGRKFVTGRRSGTNKANMSCIFNTDCIRFHNICINSYLNNSDSEDDTADDSDSQSDLEDDTNDF